ncbi:MAG: lactonase family protein [Candidatus Brocadiia bacterium]|jgi:6-phosphogluconolactonase
MSAPTGKSYVYAGTYTAKTAKGICFSRFDEAAGILEPFVLAAEMPNPTFLTIHPNGQFLYAVSEVRDSTGRHGGSVNAFAISPGTGQLRFLNRQSSEGAGPCHLSVDRTGRVVLVANYASGSAAVLPVGGDGCLGAASDKVQHHGSSVHPQRQEGPHAHSITPSPDNRFALVADLGLDRIMVYRLDASAGRLTPNDPPWAAVKPGAGPRHLAFHPVLPLVYLVTELGNTVTAFAWDALRGALREAQTISTLPPDFHDTSYGADVHIAPSGRFLYASNRGHDSIAIFSVDQSTGLLSAVGHQPTLGKWPRNFVIDSTGAWLLAANQEGDSVVVFRIEAETGKLASVGHAADVSMPVCLKLLPCG